MAGGRRRRAIVRPGSEGLRSGALGSGGWRMSRSFGWALGKLVIAAVMMLAAGAAQVSATPLTPFRYEAQAQRHCPGDKVVWLDFRKGVYYRKGQKFYGQGFD